MALSSSQQLGWVNGESSSGRVACDLKWRESAALEPCFLLQMIHWKCLSMPVTKEQRVPPFLRVTERVVSAGWDLLGAIAKIEMGDDNRGCYNVDQLQQRKDDSGSGKKWN